MENQTTKKSTMIHKENEWEWKFVGIWADMIKDNGLAEKLKNFPASETLILFKPYEKPLEISSFGTGKSAAKKSVQSVKIWR